MDRYLDGKPSSAFSASLLQNFPTASCPHSSTETVLTFANYMRGRLEILFHGLEIITHKTW